MFEQFRDKFIEDANEIIQDLEKDLLQLEANPSDKEMINRVFRVMHTLKGSAGMYGFDEISEITHQVETIYDLIRTNVLTVTTEIFNITLKTVDIVKLILNEPDYKLSESEKKQLISDIQKNGKIDNKQEESIPEVIISEAQQQDSSAKKIYYILYTPSEDIFYRGVKPMSVFNEIKESGDNTILIYNESTPLEIQIQEKKITSFWEIYLVTSKEKQEILDIFMFFLDDEYQVLQIQDWDLASNTEVKEIYSKLLLISDFHKVIAFDYYINLIKNNFSSLKIDTEATKKESTAEIKPEKIEPSSVTETIEQKEPEKDKISIDEKIKEHFIETEISTIKVSSEKLDELINLVSELITVNSGLNILSQEIQNENLSKALHTVEKLSKRFRDNALEMRLIPIQVLMVKFQRLVRDLSIKLNKKIEFVMEGTKTELDKTIINKLESPIMHLIRNSIDHGIETEDIRLKRNKSTKGIIRLIAFYSGSNVFIQIQDDGQGIDPNKIYQIAVEKGFIAPTIQLTKKEILNLIFLPGFTTAEKVTDVSGRGVGMDVVREKIGELRGEIEIDSEIELGTSVTIKLPLTLTIIDTLMVKVDTSLFMIPLAVVEICQNVPILNSLHQHSKQLPYDDALIPYIHLRQEFKINHTIPEEEKAIIIRYQDKFYAIIVDSVIGEHQAVVRPLGHMHKKQDYLLGACILGDGNLALILDTAKLIKQKKDLQDSINFHYKY